MQVVYVSLVERSYNIIVGENLLGEVGRACSKLSLATRCAIITDRKVASRYGTQMEASMRLGGFEPKLITVAPGEKSKNLVVVKSCYDQLAKHRFERDSFVVALGGGVVGDLPGFGAGTHLPGPPLL